jgi:catechol 2,3-dioxygenase-like lactoylglutathione lyase family enzyme
MSLRNIKGIHHLKFAVAELSRSLAFYEEALGAERVGKYDHFDASGNLFAYILSVPGLGAFLELRLDPTSAERQRGFDPITLLVDNREDLARWITHFASIKVPHSDILVGAVGWLVVAEDPDGRRLRFYTAELHGPELPVSWDSPWLRAP